MGSVYKEYGKDEIAAGLLETALELYFSGRDGFSVIHLAAASEEVLSEMIKGKRARRAGKRSASRLQRYSISSLRRLTVS